LQRLAHADAGDVVFANQCDVAVFKGEFGHWQITTLK
jgi:hypothetical protein